MKQKYRKAVFVVVYAKSEKEIEYIILKRKKHWKGWEFVKGKIDPFESKKKTAIRETFEETGLKPLEGMGKIKKFNFSGKYKWGKLIPERPGFVGQTFSLYGIEVKKLRNRKIKISKEEHSDSQWVSFEKGLKKLTWPNQRKSLRIVNSWLKSKRD